MRPAIGDSSIMTSPEGMTIRLATSSESPNPAPVATGSSSICGYTTFEAKRENPIATEAMFVSSTAGRAATRRSSSGSSMRSSNHPQSSSTTSPPSPHTSTGGDPQPHSLPREIASRMPMRPTARPAAPT